jgi:anti-anti-sigma factor
MSAPPRLEIREVVSEGRRTLILTGELELATVPELRAALDELPDRTTSVTLDLSALVSMDTSGLRAVLGADNLCHRKGFVLSLIAGNEAVQRTFEAAGVVDDLPFQPG